ncbi:MAG: TolC family protein [Candidatus Omnitrophica bacterium]|nr:TolC family protein [Candidatus Omnitrophota bacterium]
MRRVSICLAVVFVVHHATPAWAVREAALLMLPDLLAEARRANPSLQEARKRWEAAQAKVPQATGLPAPKIGIEFEDIPRGTVKLNQATIMYQLIQSIPFPWKLSLRHQVAVKEAQVAAMQFKQAEWDVLSGVKAAYYDLWLLDREDDLQQEQLMWIKQALASAQARYETGALPQDEFLQVQGESRVAANELVVLDHHREAMAAHLNHLLNRPVHAPVGRPENVALDAVAFTTEELMAVAQDRQPELLAMRYTLERAEAAYKLSKRELLPDLETMMELRDPAMGPIGPWDLTLAVVLPFWFWTKAKYGVKAALYDRDSMQAAYQAMQNDVARRIHEHWHESQAAFSTARLSRDELIPLARQAVTASLAAYQRGEGSAADFAEALQQLTERRRTNARQLVNLEQHVVMLEQAVGMSLRPAHESVE